MKKVLLTLLCLLGMVFPVLGEGWEATPELKLHVINAPSEDFYLDLYIEDGHTLLFDIIRRSNYDKELWDALRDSNPRDGHFGMIRGTHLKMEGDLVGTKQADGSLLYVYTGLGVPKNYSIITLTKSGEWKESMQITRKVYYDEVTYDYATGSITYREHTKVYFIHILVNIALILSIRFVAYKLLKVNRDKKEWTYFFVSTIVGSILTSYVMTAAMMYNGNLMQAAMALMILMIALSFVDFRVYGKLWHHDIMQASLVPVLVNVGVSIIVVNTLAYQFEMMWL